MTRIAILDDHRLFSASLAVALRARDLEVLEPAFTSMTDVLQQLAVIDPDVLLLDLDLGSLGRGEELVAPMTTQGASVVVVSASRDDVQIGRCLAQGAVAWVSKTAPFNTLLTTVLSVIAGEPVVTPTEHERLVQTWRRWEAASASTMERFDRLTRREAVVLGELMKGRSVEEIASTNFVSEATVRSQVRSIFVKLGTNSQLQAVALAWRARWQPPGSDDGASVSSLDHG